MKEGILKLGGLINSSPDLVLFKELLKCKEYGINTINQYIVFMACLENEGNLLADIFGSDEHSGQTSRFVLMGLMGLRKSSSQIKKGLLKYDENSNKNYRRQRAIILTSVGQQLKQEINQLRGNKRNESLSRWSDL